MELAPGIAGQICALLAVASAAPAPYQMGLAELVTVLGPLNLSRTGDSGRRLGAACAGRACQPFLGLDRMGFLRNWLLLLIAAGGLHHWFYGIEGQGKLLKYDPRPYF